MSQAAGPYGGVYGAPAHVVSAPVVVVAGKANPLDALFGRKKDSVSAPVSAPVSAVSSVSVAPHLPPQSPSQSHATDFGGFQGPPASFQETPSFFGPFSTPASSAPAVASAYVKQEESSVFGSFSAPVAAASAPLMDTPAFGEFAGSSASSTSSHQEVMFGAFSGPSTTAEVSAVGPSSSVPLGPPSLASVAPLAPPASAHVAEQKPSLDDLISKSFQGAFSVGPPKSAPTVSKAVPPSPQLQPQSSVVQEEGGSRTAKPSSNVDWNSYRSMLTVKPAVVAVTPEPIVASASASEEVAFGDFASAAENVSFGEFAAPTGSTASFVDFVVPPVAPGSVGVLAASPAAPKVGDFASNSASFGEFAALPVAPKSNGSFGDFAALPVAPKSNGSFGNFAAPKSNGSFEEPVAHVSALAAVTPKSGDFSDTSLIMEDFASKEHTVTQSLVAEPVVNPLLVEKSEPSFGDFASVSSDASFGDFSAFSQSTRVEEKVAEFQVSFPPMEEAIAVAVKPAELTARSPRMRPALQFDAFVEPRSAPAVSSVVPIVKKPSLSDLIGVLVENFRFDDAAAVSEHLRAQSEIDQARKSYKEAKDRDDLELALKIRNQIASLESKVFFFFLLF